MPKKKKVTRADVKASIKRLHKAAKKKEKLEVQPVAVRELPPQPAPEVKVQEVKPEPEVKEEPVKAEPAEVEEKPAGPERKEAGRQISTGEAFDFGWKSVKSHFWFFVLVFLLFGALSFMIYGAGAIGTKIVLGILIGGIGIGYFKLALDVVDGKSPEFKELFSCFSLLLKYLIANFVYSIVVAVGFVLLVIPGLIWAVQFGFYPFVIVKERLGPLSALRRSSELTFDVKSRLVIFALALLGINLLGAIILGLGLIVTIPLSVVAAAHVFRQLEKTHS